VVNLPDTDGFEELLGFIRRERGFDFTGYKPSSLMRRTTKRMRDVGVLDPHADRGGRLAGDAG
jgi:two-component system, chemotaxis family, CheB/CheR fusion protein